MKGEVGFKNMWFDRI